MEDFALLSSPCLSEDAAAATSAAITSSSGGSLLVNKNGDDVDDSSETTASKVQGTYSSMDDANSKAPAWRRDCTANDFRLGDFRRRAYRMTTDHFERLAKLLSPHLAPEPLPALEQFQDQNKTLRVKAALRYFAGGDPVEIASYYSIPDLFLLESYIWEVVDAINQMDRFTIEYPTDNKLERVEIATCFELFKSDEGNIKNCAGVLGGMLVPTDKPDIDDKSEREQYYSKRKDLYGFNLQAICD
jgi:hypothetical protein